MYSRKWLHRIRVSWRLRSHSHLIVRTLSAHSSFILYWDLARNVGRFLDICGKLRSVLEKIACCEAPSGLWRASNRWSPGTCQGINGNMTSVSLWVSTALQSVVSRRELLISKSDEHFFVAAKCDSCDLAFRGVVVLSCHSIVLCPIAISWVCLAILLAFLMCWWRNQVQTAPIHGAVPGLVACWTRSAHNVRGWQTHGSEAGVYGRCRDGTGQKIKKKILESLGRKAREVEEVQAGVRHASVKTLMKKKRNGQCSSGRRSDGARGPALRKLIGKKVVARVERVVLFSRDLRPGSSIPIHVLRVLVLPHDWTRPGHRLYEINSRIEISSKYTPINFLSKKNNFAADLNNAPTAAASDVTEIHDERQLTSSLSTQERERYLRAPSVPLSISEQQQATVSSIECHTSVANVKMLGVAENCDEVTIQALLGVSIDCSEVIIQAFRNPDWKEREIVHLEAYRLLNKKDFWKAKNLHDDFQREVRRALQGKCVAQRRLSGAEVKMDRKSWERRNSDMTPNETNRTTNGALWCKPMDWSSSNGNPYKIYDELMMKSVLSWPPVGRARSIQEGEK